MKLIAGMLVLVIALVTTSACLSTTTVQNSSEGPLHVHYQYYQDSWSPELGCYDHLTGYVYSTGNVSSENVRLNFNLVNIETGTIRDSKPIFIDSLAPGDTVSYEAMLDGECTQDYRVDFAFEH
jgi:hypothetical protein